MSPPTPTQHEGRALPWYGSGPGSIPGVGSGGRESTCFGGASSGGHHASILKARSRFSKPCLPSSTLGVRSTQPECFGRTRPCQGLRPGSIPGGCSSDARRWQREADCKPARLGPIPRRVSVLLLRDAAPGLLSHGAQARLLAGAPCPTRLLARSRRSQRRGCGSIPQWGTKCPCLRLRR